MSGLTWKCDWGHMAHGAFTVHWGTTVHLANDLLGSDKICRQSAWGGGENSSGEQIITESIRSPSGNELRDKWREQGLKRCYQLGDSRHLRCHCPVLLKQSKTIQRFWHRLIRIRKHQVRVLFTSILPFL
ncbi:hypothetical protein CDAR_126601 [Caerostris darwini]|uniref:Uncharacterized protein n=1 Tax=Caerostris darwini TaxID=1538125 RepID=A0AAV4S122_9ARAC|nr:hypothetical protein CDAR_126601 [Caerostris darwini]